MRGSSSPVWKKRRAIWRSSPIAPPTQGHGLGRHTMPEMIEYSAVTAVHTIWLAARAQGIGMGWVSILDPAAVATLLDVPRTGNSSAISVSAIRRPTIRLPSLSKRMGTAAFAVIGHRSALRERAASSREGQMQTPRLSAATLQSSNHSPGTSEAAGPTVRCSPSAAHRHRSRQLRAPPSR